VQAIVLQSFVAAPPEPVWGALVTHQALLFDGLPASAWPAERTEQAPLHLECDWPWTPEPTKVSLTLHELGGGTRVDVRHTGWQESGEWEAPLQGHFAGWLQGLAAFGLMVETGVDARATSKQAVGRQRYFISGEIPAPAAPVYRSLTDHEVLERWSDGRFAAAVAHSAENRFVRWVYGDGREVTAILRPTPRGTHLAIAEYGGAGQAASGRWPAMFESLTQFLA
jgi:hypothetical protein